MRRTATVRLIAAIALAAPSYSNPSWAAPAGPPSTAVPADMRFADRAGDRIRSDGNPSYTYNYPDVNPRFNTQSGDFILGLASGGARKLTFDFPSPLPPDAACPMAATDLSPGVRTEVSGIIVRAVYHLQVGQSFMTTATFYPSPGTLNFGYGPNVPCSSQVIATRTSETTWVFTAEPGANDIAGVVRFDKKGQPLPTNYYRMPWQIHVTKR